MTYEEFKKALCRNVQNMETAQNKTIRLLERQMICSDPMAVHIMSVMNRHMYGRENILIREDMLCAMWSLKREEQIQYWPVRPLYERYRQEGWQSILPEISAGLEESDKKKDVSFTEESLSYAVCRGHMRIQPVNFERHRHTLENAIQRKIGDIALVLQLIICEGNPDNLTMQLSRNRIMTWERTEDQLIMEAFMNSSRKMPPRLYLGSDRRPEFPYYEGVFLPDEKGRPTKIAPWNPMEGRTGYLLTTTGRINGAAAFFYPGVKDILAEKMRGDYYVVFPSLHEAMIHPVACVNAEEIRTSVQHINAIYGEEEMLSDRVFCYRRNRRLLQLL